MAPGLRTALQREGWALPLPERGRVQNLTQQGWQGVSPSSRGGD